MPISEVRTRAGTEKPRAGTRRWRLAALAFVFFWFAIGGVAHFVAPDGFLRIVPPWVPAPFAVVLISGAFELLGAMGILWRKTRRAAGIGLVLLTLAVTPANVWMLQRHTDWPGIPVWLLIARLVLQAALLVLIVWSTAPVPAPARQESLPAG